MPPVILDDPATARSRLRRALDALAANDADLAGALARLGYPEPRLRPPGFATLLQIITAQQLSTKAAAAIQRRVEAAMGGEVTPERLLALDGAMLRQCGFSARKVDYAQGLAAAIAEARLVPSAFATMDDAAVIAALTALPGFGRWSAEIYLLFALQRLDVLPAGDLALQVGFKRLKGLERRPTAQDLREAMADWAPYRGAGAVFLWHFYGAATLDAAR